MTVDIDSTVNATLRDWRRSAFAWSGRNCLLSLADYARDLTGMDVGAPWRGLDGEAEARAALVTGGGALAMMDGALRAAGFVPVQVPRRGDIICARIDDAEIGGLCTGACAAFRMERGVLEVRLGLVTIIGAWRP